MEGCQSDNGDMNKTNLRLTLLDSVDTSVEKLNTAGHQKGAKCRCSECERLKAAEDKWICRLGTFYGEAGLNTRDEIKTKFRVNFY